LALYHQLEAQSPARGPVAAPARKDVQQAIRRTRTRFRRRRVLKRLFSPVQTAAWVGITVALTVVVAWMLKIPDPQPQTGLTIPVTVEVTSTATPSPSATPRPTARPTIAFLSAYFYTQEEVVADVDLNCDGLDERLVSVETYANGAAKGKLYPYGSIGVVLQVPTQEGYRQVWEHRCDPSSNGFPDCYETRVGLLPTGNCEQLITFSGTFDDTGRLMVFWWDGESVSVVLDVAMDDYTFTQDPFVLTIIQHWCMSSARCVVEHETSYTWNGAEFVPSD
jgi:hypothetical protein